MTDIVNVDKGLLTALSLPDSYVISGSFQGEQDALSRIQIALQKGEKLLQLRAKNLTETEFIILAKKAVKLVHQYQGAKILLNGRIELLNLVPEADGLQLSSTIINDFSKRPIPKNKLLGVSTHSKEEIAKALTLEADFILLSPVTETSSHPEALGMGWKVFQSIVDPVPIPVYALGGMDLDDISIAKKNGGQGIAAISGLWPKTP